MRSYFDADRPTLSILSSLTAGQEAAQHSVVHSSFSSSSSSSPPKFVLQPAKPWKGFSHLRQQQHLPHREPAPSASSPSLVFYSKLSPPQPHRQTEQKPRPSPRHEDKKGAQQDRPPTAQPKNLPPLPPRSTASGAGATSPSTSPAAPAQTSFSCSSSSSSLSQSSSSLSLLPSKLVHEDHQRAETRGGGEYVRSQGALTEAIHFHYHTHPTRAPTPSAVSRRDSSSSSPPPLCQVNEGRRVSSLWDLSMDRADKLGALQRSCQADGAACRPRAFELTQETDWGGGGRRLEEKACGPFPVGKQLKHTQRQGGHLPSSLSSCSAAGDRSRVYIQRERGGERPPVETSSREINEEERRKQPSLRGSTYKLVSHDEPRQNKVAEKCPSSTFGSSAISSPLWSQQTVQGKPQVDSTLQFQSGVCTPRDGGGQSLRPNLSVSTHLVPPPTDVSAKRPREKTLFGISQRDENSRRRVSAERNSSLSSSCSSSLFSPSSFSSSSRQPLPSSRTLISKPFPFSSRVSPATQSTANSSSSSSPPSVSSCSFSSSSSSSCVVGQEISFKPRSQAPVLSPSAREVSSKNPPLSPSPSSFSLSVTSQSQGSKLSFSVQDANKENLRLNQPNRSSLSSCFQPQSSSPSNTSFSTHDTFSAESSPFFISDQELDMLCCPSLASCMRQHQHASSSSSSSSCSAFSSSSCSFSSSSFAAGDLERGGALGDEEGENQEGQKRPEKTHEEAPRPLLLHHRTKTTPADPSTVSLRRENPTLPSASPGAQSPRAKGVDARALEREDRQAEDAGESRVEIRKEGEKTEEHRARVRGSESAQEESGRVERAAESGAFSPTRLGPGSSSRTRQTEERQWNRNRPQEGEEKEEKVEKRSACVEEKERERADEEESLNASFSSSLVLPPHSKIFGRLSAAQRLVVLAPPHANLCVIAGPGSGKTSTITARVIRLLLQGYGPLLVLTFTRRGADELKHRLVEGLASTLHDLRLLYKSQHCTDRGRGASTPHHSPATSTASSSSSSCSSSSSSVGAYVAFAENDIGSKHVNPSSSFSSARSSGVCTPLVSGVSVPQSSRMSAPSTSFPGLLPPPDLSPYFSYLSSVHFDFQAVYKRVFVGTFHRFGMEVLRRYGRALGIPPSFQTAGSLRQSRVAKTVIEDFKRMEYSLYGRDPHQLANELYSGHVTFQRLRAEHLHSKKLSTSPDPAQEERRREQQWKTNERRGEKNPSALDEENEEDPDGEMAEEDEEEEDDDLNSLFTDEEEEEEESSRRSSSYLHSSSYRPSASTRRHGGGEQAGGSSPGYPNRLHYPSSSSSFSVWNPKPPYNPRYERRTRTAGMDEGEQKISCRNGRVENESASALYAYTSREGKVLGEEDGGGTETQARRRRGQRNHGKRRERESSSAMKATWREADGLLRLVRRFKFSSRFAALLEKENPRAHSLVQKYQRALSGHSPPLLDYSDLLLYTLMLLEKNHGEIRLTLHRSYPIVLVDEFQDTSLTQFKILRLLTKARAPHEAEEDPREPPGLPPRLQSSSSPPQDSSREGGLTVVGDDDQSIYGFRGIDGKNFSMFDRAFPNHLELHLSCNYRSLYPIVSTGFSLISYNNPHRRPKRLHASSASSSPSALPFLFSQASSSSSCRREDEQHSADAERRARRGAEEERGGEGVGTHSRLLFFFPPVMVGLFVSPEAEAIYIVRYILALKQARHLCWTDFAILSRTNKALKEIEDLLQSPRILKAAYAPSMPGTSSTLPCIPMQSLLEQDRDQSEDRETEERGGSEVGRKVGGVHKGRDRRRDEREERGNINPPCSSAQRPRLSSSSSSSGAGGWYRPECPPDPSILCPNWGEGFEFPASIPLRSTAAKHRGVQLLRRADVQVVLSYLRLVVDPHHDGSFLRTLNKPARGLGSSVLLRTLCSVLRPAEGAEGEEARARGEEGEGGASEVPDKQRENAKKQEKEKKQKSGRDGGCLASLDIRWREGPLDGLDRIALPSSPFVSSPFEEFRERNLPRQSGGWTEGRESQSGMSLFEAACLLTAGLREEEEKGDEREEEEETAAKGGRRRRRGGWSSSQKISWKTLKTLDAHLRSLVEVQTFARQESTGGAGEVLRRVFKDFDLEKLFSLREGRGGEEQNKIHRGRAKEEGGRGGGGATEGPQSGRRPADSPDTSPAPHPTREKKKKSLKGGGGGEEEALASLGEENASDPAVVGLKTLDPRQSVTKERLGEDEAKKKKKKTCQREDLWRLLQMAETYTPNASQRRGLDCVRRFLVDCSHSTVFLKQANLPQETRERSSSYSSRHHHERPDCLSISTIHQAKGLEWKVVILARSHEGHLPFEREGSHRHALTSFISSSSNPGPNNPSALSLPPRHVSSTSPSSSSLLRTRQPLHQLRFKERDAEGAEEETRQKEGDAGEGFLSGIGQGGLHRGNVEKNAREKKRGAGGGGEGEREEEEDEEKMKLMEERRLCYVAFTRARECLLVTSPLMDANRKFLTPSRFLKESRLSTYHPFRTMIEPREKKFSPTSSSSPKEEAEERAKEQAVVQKGWNSVQREEEEERQPCDGGGQSDAKQESSRLSGTSCSSSFACFPLGADVEEAKKKRKKREEEEEEEEDVKKGKRRREEREEEEEEESKEIDEKEERWRSACEVRGGAAKRRRGGQEEEEDEDAVEDRVDIERISIHREEEIGTREFLEGWKEEEKEKKIEEEEDDEDVAERDSKERGGEGKRGAEKAREERRSVVERRGKEEGEEEAEEKEKAKEEEEAKKEEEVDDEEVLVIDVKNEREEGRVEKEEERERAKMTEDHTRTGLTARSLGEEIAGDDILQILAEESQESFFPRGSVSRVVSGGGIEEEKEKTRTAFLYPHCGEEEESAYVVGGEESPIAEDSSRRRRTSSERAEDKARHHAEESRKETESRSAEEEEENVFQAGSSLPAHFSARALASLDENLRDKRTSREKNGLFSSSSPPPSRSLPASSPGCTDRGSSLLRTYVIRPTVARGRRIGEASEQEQGEEKEEEEEEQKSEEERPYSCQEEKEEGGDHDVIGRSDLSDKRKEEVVSSSRQRCLYSAMKRTMKNRQGPLHSSSFFFRSLLSAEMTNKEDAADQATLTFSSSSSSPPALREEEEEESRDKPLAALAASLPPPSSSSSSSSSSLLSSFNAPSRWPKENGDKTEASSPSSSSSCPPPHYRRWRCLLATGRRPAVGEKNSEEEEEKKRRRKALVLAGV